ncbi:Glutathione reductase [Novosphingobium resinovorum]|uniref:Glutathione reductase n=1 Tax=Novosphingobium resinovorum TaxID=158500 RepID=A0A031K402_9SPHN|nr:MULTISPECIES: glutathione-disulfide reductase [Novosphingobium]EZP83939.1 Glutathione reductase [Novosphingobium resinovorum]
MFDFDLFVIGAGSGGVRAARASAAHGARVAIAEEFRVGGTCVIRGCVPKKMLFYGAQFAEDLHNAKRFGWTIGDALFDWKALQKAVLDDVDRLNGLYQQTLDNNRATTYHHRARIVGPNEVELADGTRITAATILIATGATPVVPHVEGAEFGVTSNEAFEIDALPRDIVIAGSGYIAIEFAGIFNALGSRVTIVNRSNRLLAGFDEQIRDRLLAISLANGINFRFNARFEKIARDAAGELNIHLDDGGEPISCDTLLFAIGRRPNSDGIGLDDLGVALDDSGAVKVDAQGRTNIPSIYAIGDVTNRIQLTPIAIREGQAFADTMFGGRPNTVDYDHVPSAVFSHPPLAGVGLTEREAREGLESVSVHVSDFRPMKNVLAGRDERALFKMICDATTGRIVGLHMIGPEAPELLQIAAVAVKAGLTKQDFDDTVALHPSMAEELVLLK